MAAPAGSVAFVHLFLLLSLAAAWSRPLAKLTLRPYSPAWVGRTPAFVLYAGFWAYLVWLVTCLTWLESVRNAPAIALAIWGLEGVAVTFVLVAAARYQRAPATWTPADFDRFCAADSPRWWRLEQERRQRQVPPPEDFERMRRLEDSLLGPAEAPSVKRRPRRRARPTRSHRSRPGR